MNRREAAGSSTHVWSPGSLLTRRPIGGKSADVQGSRKLSFLTTIWGNPLSASVRQIPPHWLQFGYSEDMTNRGCTRSHYPKVAQERLGHARIAITLDTYSHLLPGMQGEAVDKLDCLFAALNGKVRLQCGDRGW